MGKTLAPRALVVGSGLAGLEYARTLAAESWRVEVISPGRVGRDGATHRVRALAPWILLTAPWVRGDSPERFLADLKLRGEGSERVGLAEVLAAEAHEAARELMETLDLAPLGEVPLRLAGDEFPRGLRCLPPPGRLLLAPLLKRCEAAGVRLSSRKLAVGVVSDGQRVSGALVIDRTTHDVQRVDADAVVLACGGVGAVFPVATVPRWIRGSGLALASAAGALLHRPGLTQALPVTATPPLYFPTSAALLSGTIRIDGRPLPAVSDLEAFTGVMAEALRRGAHVSLEPSDEGAAVLPPRLRQSTTFRTDGSVHLTLALHHGIGGVAIDAWGRTSLPGLYACGEAAGGVQGRRRTMGTGLLEAFVFARRAAHATSRDIRRPGTELAGEIAMPPLPGDPSALEARLDVLLGPLAVLRPDGEVASVLREIRGWPSLPIGSLDERGALAGIRRLAALAILAGESEDRGSGMVVGLHYGAPANGE